MTIDETILLKYVISILNIRLDFAHRFFVGVWQKNRNVDSEYCVCNGERKKRKISQPILKK